LQGENFIDKDMRNSMLKMFILRSVGRESTNSYALLKEFSKRRRFFSRFGGVPDLKNEVYNTINSLEKSGYIKSSQKIENGRLKNYYFLTIKGRKVTNSAKVLFRRHIQALSALLKD